MLADAKQVRHLPGGPKRDTSDSTASTNASTTRNTVRSTFLVFPGFVQFCDEGVTVGEPKLTDGLTGEGVTVRGPLGL